ncbi:MULTISPECIES: mersacidin/lichenicidin family type 2 lantibiotic [Herpetosiphon]|uniref:mersacidin/lichenicidin family type 2 lantibiotic n=1 Tax=Herpetosiphon TaxID=64 RepID=UPI00195CB225|nr:mersacidin/lichenicidin family type 2 lantibiotic [Herpetosiphon giganteus]MBM7841564.1 mersacidin/lichenicidin family type 2 lantibiotic [Herpetosiphon giganteus]
MSHEETINAWNNAENDPESEPTNPESTPANPAGMTELSDEELRQIQGGLLDCSIIPTMTSVTSLVPCVVNTSDDQQ